MRVRHRARSQRAIRPKVQTMKTPCFEEAHTPDAEFKAGPVTDVPDLDGNRLGDVNRRRLLAITIEPAQSRAEPPPFPYEQVAA